MKNITLIFIGVSAIASNAFAAEKLSVHCRNYDGETVIEAQLTVPESIAKSEPVAYSDVVLRTEKNVPEYNLTLVPTYQYLRIASQSYSDKLQADLNTFKGSSNYVGEDYNSKQKLYFSFGLNVALTDAVANGGTVNLNIHDFLVAHFNAEDDKRNKMKLVRQTDRAYFADLVAYKGENATLVLNDRLLCQVSR